MHSNKEKPKPVERKHAHQYVAVIRDLADLIKHTAQNAPQYNQQTQAEMWEDVAYYALEILAEVKGYDKKWGEDWQDDMDRSNNIALSVLKGALGSVGIDMETPETKKDNK
jgi:hypothetical protein